MSIYIPYTYLIGWSAIGKYYYGVRYAKGCHPDDLWSEYFTSSSSVAEYRLEYGEPDIVQIRKIFDTAEEAISWENRFLRRISAHRREDFLNASAFPAMSPEAMASRTPWNKGKRGFVTSEETKKKLSASGLGKKKPGTSKSMLNNTKTKGYRWYTDGSNDVLIAPNETTPIGYRRGRSNSNMPPLKGVAKSNSAKKNMSIAAKERSKIRACCLQCHKELPSNSLASHWRFCI